jgi:hypothetical protein
VKYLPNSSLFVFLAVLSTACVSSRPATPRELPPVVRPTGNPTSSTGPWAFRHSPGTRAYRISRNASVDGSADSAAQREIISNLTHQILTLDDVGGGDLAFRLVVDTFAVITQGVVGPPQHITLPIELVGNVDASGLRLESAATDECNPVRATVTTDLYNLLPRFPSPLSTGTRWRDSVSAWGCHAGIPTTVVTRRAFSVGGEIEHLGRRLVLVQRIDSTTARGKGAYNQHRMEIESAGNGTATYYLDTGSGEVSQLTTSQRASIKVTTSGRVHTFTQVVNQDFVRVR